MITNSAHNKIKLRNRRFNTWLIAPLCVIVLCLAVSSAMLAFCSPKGTTPNSDSTETDSLEQQPVNDEPVTEVEVPETPEQVETPTEQPTQNTPSQSKWQTYKPPSNNTTTNEQPTYTPPAEPQCDEVKKAQYVADYNTAIANEEARYRAELVEVESRATADAYKTTSCGGGMRYSTFCGDKIRKLKAEYKVVTDATHQSIVNTLTRTYGNNLSVIHCN